MFMKKKIQLYSTNPKEYPNIKVKVKIMGNASKAIDKIAEKEDIIAQKTAIVQARQAIKGDVVDTRPRVIFEGKEYTFSETKQIITQEKEDAGAVIITNPDGEEYVIASKEKFEKKYKKVDTGYSPISDKKPFRKSNGNYAITTSWGEEQICLKDSYFCVKHKDDIYGITNSAFNAKYKIQNS